MRAAQFQFVELRTNGGDERPWRGRTKMGSFFGQGGGDGIVTRAAPPPLFWRRFSLAMAIFHPQQPRNSSSPVFQQKNSKPERQSMANVASSPSLSAFFSSPTVVRLGGNSGASRELFPVPVSLSSRWRWCSPTTAGGPVAYGSNVNGSGGRRDEARLVAAVGAFPMKTTVFPPSPVYVTAADLSDGGWTGSLQFTFNLWEQTEAGNEVGYVVEMSTCYPQPGSVNIAQMEKLTIISNYTNVQMHTGVMGYYYILVAETLPKSNSIFHSLDVADLVAHRRTMSLPRTAHPPYADLSFVAGEQGRRQSPSKEEEEAGSGSCWTPSSSIAYDSHHRSSASNDANERETPPGIRRCPSRRESIAGVATEEKKQGWKLLAGILHCCHVYDLNVHSKEEENRAAV
nr:MtN19 like protein [Ipomoea batatas]